MRSTSFRRPISLNGGSYEIQITLFSINFASLFFLDKISLSFVVSLLKTSSLANPEKLL